MPQAVSVYSIVNQNLKIDITTEMDSVTSRCEGRAGIFPDEAVCPLLMPPFRPS